MTLVEDEMGHVEVSFLDNAVLNLLLEENTKF